MEKPSAWVTARVLAEHKFPAVAPSDFAKARAFEEMLFALVAMTQESSKGLAFEAMRNSASALLNIARNAVVADDNQATGGQPATAGQVF
jgi:hypothetical protein